MARAPHSWSHAALVRQAEVVGISSSVCAMEIFTARINCGRGAQKFRFCERLAQPLHAAQYQTNLIREYQHLPWLTDYGRFKRNSGERQGT